MSTASATRILLVEDDTNLGFVIQDTLRMQGVVNLTERLELAGEAEVVVGTEDSESAEGNQSASTTSNDRQTLRGTFVLSDAWRAEADLRSGYRSDDEGSVLELLLNLHWRLWVR